MTQTPVDEVHETRIDLWADVVCPWCWIGKRRVEEAVAASERPAEVTVLMHAFELDPGTPVGSGALVVDHLARAYGTDRAGAEQMQDRVAGLAREAGLPMDLTAQVRANSLDDHRLVALGLEQGGPALQSAVAERMFSAHFAEGKVIDDHEVLQRLAAEAGLDEAGVASVLASDELTDVVRADEDLARRLGITGVPFAVARAGDGNGVAVSGAQPVEVFGQLITQARSHQTARSGGRAV